MIILSHTGYLIRTDQKGAITMTENEAIKKLEKFQLQIEHSIAEEDCCEYRNSEKILQEDKEFLDAFNIAISALEEIQQYRKIGTVENIKLWCSLFGLGGFEELAAYRKIGTVEECREAVEERERGGKGKTETILEACPLCKGEATSRIVCENGEFDVYNLKIRCKNQRCGIEKGRRVRLKENTFENLIKEMREMTREWNERGEGEGCKN